MTDARRVVCAALLVSSACLPREELALPEVGQTLILLARGQTAGDTFVFVIDRTNGSEPPPLLASSKHDLWVFAYETPIGDLDLEPGAQVVERGEDAQKIPAMDRVFLAADGVLRFEERELGAEAEAIEDVLISSIGMPMCSCYRVDAEKHRALCSDSCPLPRLMSPEPPLPPVPADLESCPAGWSLVAQGGAHICLPRPRESCPAGEASFVGGAGCEPIGAPCPSGRFATNLTGAIYVDDATGPGGTGSELDPFHDLDVALATLPPGGTLALSKGSFALELDLDAPITLIGACARDTVLTPRTSTRPIVTVRGPAVSLVGLGLRAGATAIELREGGALSLEAVRVEGSAAAIVEGGILHTRRSLFAGSTGIAVQLFGAGRVNMNETNVESAGGWGLVLHDGETVARLGDVRIAGAGDPGVSIQVRAVGARLSAERLVLDNVADTGIRSEGGQLELTDVVIVGRGGPRDAFGIVLVDCVTSTTADLVARHVSVLDQAGTAIWVNDGCRAQIEDAYFGRNQEGLRTYRADVVASRLVLEAHRGASLPLIESSVSLSDVSVTGTTTPNGALNGEALAVVGSTVTITRLLVSGVSYAGLVLAGGAHATLSDVRIQGTHAELDASDEPILFSGYGVIVRDSSVLNVDRLVVSGSSFRGIHAEGGCDESFGGCPPRSPSIAALELNDAVVIDNHAEGVYLLRAGLTATRLEITRSYCTGLRVSGSATRIDDLAITDSVSQTTGTCDLPRFGQRAWGTAIVAGAKQQPPGFEAEPPSILRIDGFVVRGSRGLGLIVLEDDTRLELFRGAVLECNAEPISFTQQERLEDIDASVSFQPRDGRELLGEPDQ